MNIINILVITKDKILIAVFGGFIMRLGVGLVIKGGSVVDGFEQYTALTIISKYDEIVKSVIVNDFNKAIPVYKGERAYLPGSFHKKHDSDIVVTIVTRLEIHRITNAIIKNDPAAFFYVNNIKEVKGGVIKQLRKH